MVGRTQRALWCLARAAAAATQSLIGNAHYSHDGAQMIALQVHNLDKTGNCSGAVLSQASALLDEADDDGCAGARQLEHRP
ncbi:hypothetical protein M885DRAFT_577671 [Pelagophyceae sp. CCMP2097]|nr:hypothetical protein M885DRAFT_577671 [Pelagophyceae sp. CCMP2097]